MCAGQCISYLPACCPLCRPPAPAAACFCLCWRFCLGFGRRKYAPAKLCTDLAVGDLRRCSLALLCAFGAVCLLHECAVALRRLCLWCPAACPHTPDWQCLMPSPATQHWCCQWHSWWRCAATGEAGGAEAGRSETESWSEALFDSLRISAVLAGVSLCWLLCTSCTTVRGVDCRLLLLLCLQGCACAD